MVAVTVLTENGSGIVECRVRARDALGTWLHASAIDRRLGRGEPPEADLALALRARWLVRPASRRAIAAALRRVIAAAHTPASIMDPVQVCRPRARAAEPELRALVDRIAGGGPVSAFGIARLRSLLSDGAGPLYHHRCPDDLRTELRRVLAALDVLG